MKSGMPLVAVAATGSGGASSSGFQYREGPRCSPSRNPPVHSPVVFEAQGVPLPRTPHRGAAKSVFPIEEVTTLSPLLFRDIAMNRLGPLPHSDATPMLMLA